MLQPPPPDIQKLAFANRPRERQRCTTKLVRGDERRSAWVPFPNGKLYMLPIIARHQKMVPVFDDEGGVTVKVQPVDDVHKELARLADEVLLYIASTTGSSIEYTANAYGAFMRLVKAFLVANYDLTNDEIAEVLTCGGQELNDLWSQIIQHTLRQ